MRMEITVSEPRALELVRADKDLIGNLNPQERAQPGKHHHPERRSRPGRARECRRQRGRTERRGAGRPWGR